MDALSTATKPLHRGAVMNAHEVRSLCPAGFGPLIRAVGAVAVPVAGPQVWKANCVVALEGSGTAGDGRAGFLVAAVLAVQVVITQKGGRHALAALAAELGPRALLGR